MTLVYLDIETTGLDPERHQVVELAYAIGDGPVCSSVVDHDLANAEEAALKVCQYWERGLASAEPEPGFEDSAQLALDGATVVGANPAFDTEFLRHRWGRSPWRYRRVDIESYAMPILGHDEPVGLSSLAAKLTAMNFKIPSPDHTAGGDVAATRAIHRALVSLAATLRRTSGMTR
jgi:DNA polymerase-3 subunit epsilon